MILKKCRVCNSKKFSTVVNLKNQPLANNLAHRVNQKVKLYPLKVSFCKNCSNSQLSIVVSHKKLFNNYFYKSSISSTLKEHFFKAANLYIRRFKLNKFSNIMDIGSNDGIGLLPYKKKFFKNLFGVEPAKNLYKITNKMNIKTYNSFLNSKIANKNINKFDLITASNVFAHADDIKGLTQNTMKMLKKSGVFIVEVQYFPKMLIDGSFDNIYHEHVNYWCLLSLQYFFKLNQAQIFDVEMINTHGGSIRIYIKKDVNKDIKIKNKLKKILDYEKKFFINYKKLFIEFQKKIDDRKLRFKSKIKEFFEKKKIIVGYGAPAKATTLINFFNLEKYLSYVIDDNLLKNGKFIPNTNVKILKKFKKNNIDIILVFAWNYYNEIKSKNKDIAKKFLKIF